MGMMGGMGGMGRMGGMGGMGGRQSKMMGGMSKMMMQMMYMRMMMKMMNHVLPHKKKKGGCATCGGFKANQLDANEFDQYENLYSAMDIDSNYDDGYADYYADQYEDAIYRYVSILCFFVVSSHSISI